MSIKKNLCIALLLAMPCYASAGSVAYVSNQDGAVTVIDLETMEVKGHLEIDAKGARGIGVTQDGKWLITANKDDGNISVVDTASGKLVRHVAIGKNPEFLRVQDDNAYVTFEPGVGNDPVPQQTAVADDKIPGHIAVVALSTGKLLLDIVGKPETEGLELGKQGLIVANESDNSLSMHDFNSGKLLKNISVARYGDRPRGIKASPDGSLYVATLEFSSKFLVLNDKFEIIKEVATGKSPVGISFDHDGKRVFVASSKEKALQVYDAKTWAKLEDIPVGDRCWHFTFTPDNQQILLACGKSNELLVIDANRLEVTKRISNRGLPWGIVTYPKAMGSLDRP